MFPEIRRKQKKITKEACGALLHKEKRGVLALNGRNGYPYAIPINFYFDEKEGTIYFHGAKEGEKLECLKLCDKVCFTVYGNEKKKEGEWAPYIESVVVFGTGFLVKEETICKEKLCALAQKYYPTFAEAEKETNVSAKQVQMLALHIDYMSGKWVQEK